MADKLDDATAAHLWRLEEAKRLLRECGFTERPDGTWVRPDDATASAKGGSDS